MLQYFPYRLLGMASLVSLLFFISSETITAEPLSGCAKCHTDEDRIDELTEQLIVLEQPPSVSDMQEGVGCMVKKTSFDLYEKVLVDPAFLETSHGEVGCQVCHLGNPTADEAAEAHIGMVSLPSLNNMEASCGPCHGAILNTAKDSLHAKPDNLLKAMEKRATPEQWHIMLEKNVPQKHCFSCHVSSCGDCHVSRPKASGGGLTSGHIFHKTPDFVYQCLPCHGAVTKDFTGEQGSGDVHYRDGRMVCTDCHGGEEMHASSQGKIDHQRLPELPRCTDCHRNLEQGSIRQHAIHANTVDCTVCHAQAYTNCTSCHMGTDVDGLPYFQNGEPKVQIKIGLNTEKKTGEKGPTFVLVRQVPVRPDSYEAYLGEDLKRFDELPTYKNTTPPHNIQRKTWQNAHCNHCHGNRELFLTPQDIEPELRKANKSVIVPEDLILKPIPNLEAMALPPTPKDPLTRVSAQWLHDHLEDEDILILDARDVGPYEDDHIPGAYSFCYCHVRTSNVAKPPYMMYSPEELAAEFVKLVPLTPEKRVVIYGTGSNMRGVVFFALERIGHKKISFLDGSFSTWEDMEFPTEDGPSPAFKAVEPYPVQPKNILIDSKTIQQQMELGELILLDARKVSQFMGHTKRSEAHHAGRIPGAVSLPLKALMTHQGLFRSPAELNWILQNNHIYPGVRGTIVTSCNTNALAAELFMILRSMGYDNLMVHDGSWLEWAEMTK